MSKKFSAEMAIRKIDACLIVFTSSSLLAGFVALKRRLSMVDMVAGAAVADMACNYSDWVDRILTERRISDETGSGSG
jgi:hypothetical protein